MGGLSFSSTRTLYGPEPEVWEQRPVAGEDGDLLEMADPLEIREGVEIVRDIDLDELPDDINDPA